MKPVLERHLRAAGRAFRRASNFLTDMSTTTDTPAAALADIKKQAVEIEAQRDCLAKIDERRSESLKTAKRLAHPPSDQETPEEAQDRHGKKLAATSYADELDSQGRTLEQEILSKERRVRNSLASVGQSVRELISTAREAFVDEEIERLTAGVDPIYRRPSQERQLGLLRNNAREIVQSSTRFRSMGEALECALVQTSDSIAIATLIERTEAAVRLAEALE